MLTDTLLRSLKPTGRPFRIRDKATDPGARGFGVQVSARGVVSFCVEYTYNGQRQSITLGNHTGKKGGMTLADARTECRRVRDLLGHQVDPKLERERRLQAEREERRRLDETQEEERSAATVQDVLDAYVDSLRNVRTAAEVRQMFKLNVVPYLAKRKARTVTDEDIEDVLHRVSKRGAKVVAHNLHGYLHAAFAHATRLKRHNGRKFALTANPVASVRKPPGARPGLRDLSPEEIGALWHILPNSGLEPATQAALRLVLVTGQRVEEILGAPWAELKLEGDKGYLLDIPPNRLKTGVKQPRGHVVPLTDLAMEIIESLPRVGPFMFPKRGQPKQPMPFRTLSQAIARLCDAEAERDEPRFKKFTPRDLRRTVKTRMAALGVLKEIRDRVQNHALHDVASKHYDRFDYFKQKRAALRRWERALRSFIQPSAASADQKLSMATRSGLEVAEEPGSSPGPTT